MYFSLEKSEHDLQAWWEIQNAVLNSRLLLDSGCAVDVLQRRKRATCGHFGQPGELVRRLGLVYINGHRGCVGERFKAFRSRVRIRGCCGHS